MKIYFGNIQGLSGGLKIPLLTARTNDSDIIHLSETNKRPGDEGGIKLGCKIGRVSHTPNPDRTGPGFGSFIGTKTMEKNAGDSIWCHDFFEITSVTRVFKGCKLTVIGVYRSPSMTNDEIDAFYDALDDVVSREVNVADVVIMGGDDNSHNDPKSCAKARKAFMRLEGIRNKGGGVHVVDELTHAKHQTDHVISFHDALRFGVTAVVCPGVGDHCEIHVEVASDGLVREDAKWSRRRVVVDSGQYEVVDMHLRAKLNGFDLDFVDSFPFINQWLLDKLLEQWDRVVKEVRFVEETAIFRNFPSEPGPLKGKEQREWQFCKNKLTELYKKLQNSSLTTSEKTAVKTSIQEWKVKFNEAGQKAGWAKMRKDMAQRRKFQKSNSALFFQSTANHMKSDQIDVAYSDEELAKKLIKAEENYYLKGPPLQRSDFHDIVPDANFAIPYDEEIVLHEIEGLKKVDTWYKKYRKALAPSLAALAYAIGKAVKFPSECKILKLCFLKARTIFSADFMTKFLESLVLNGLGEVLPPETLGQFAYEPGRSTVLCVAFGLNEIEKMPDLGIGWAADQVKAFDSARWSTICQVMQKEAGAGEFIYQYFTDRNYRYKGELGFKDHPQGRGTMPGSRLGPKLFSKFQSSNKSCTFENDTWKSPGAFSDDILPLAMWHMLLNGMVQKGIDDSWKWSQDNFVSYHLTGKKAPEYFIFRHSGDVSAPVLPAPLMLGDTEIRRSYEITQLGINIKLFGDEEEANEFGYLLNWKSTKTEFSRLAYRLQQVRESFVPENRWMMCRAYIIGKIQYASALYFLRATPDNIENVRFYYAMSLAAIMGLSTPEVISLRCCKSQRVKADNKGYLAAIKFLNLPELEDMAIEGSKSLLGQWSEWRPSQFIFDDEFNMVGPATEEKCLLRALFEQSKKARNDWYPHFNSVKGPEKKNINFKIDDLPLWSVYLDFIREACAEYVFDDKEKNHISNGIFMLMCRDHFNALEPVTRAKKMLDPKISVSMKRKCSDAVDDTFPNISPPSAKKTLVDPDIIVIRDPSTVSETSKRKRGGVDEKLHNYDKVIDNDLFVFTDPGRDKTAPAKTKRCKVDNRSAKQKSGPKYLDRLHCAVKLPKVRGRKTNPCRICGYAIGKQKIKDRKAGIPFSVKFSCCDSTAHIECWRVAAVISSDIKCSALRWLLKKDKTSKVMVLDDKEQARHESHDHALCEFCGKLLDLREDKAKHLEDECSALAAFRAEAERDGHPAKKLAVKCLWLICAKLKLKIVRRDIDGNSEGMTEPVSDVNSRSVSADSQVT